MQSLKRNMKQKNSCDILKILKYAKPKDDKGISQTTEVIQGQNDICPVAI